MCRLSYSGKFPKVKLLFEANKALQKLKSRTVSITFPQLGRSSDLNIVYYADATYASLEDGFSWGGYHFCLWHNKQNGSYMLVIKKKSLLTSETLVLSEAADAGVLITAMLQETFVKQTMHLW